LEGKKAGRSDWTKTAQVGEGKDGREMEKVAPDVKKEPGERKGDTKEKKAMERGIIAKRWEGR